jgi:hypothetical protein
LDDFGDSIKVFKFDISLTTVDSSLEFKSGIVGHVLLILCQVFVDIDAICCSNLEDYVASVNDRGKSYFEGALPCI